VFINVPFDDDYRRLHEAIIFAVYDCGFLPRSAQEIDDSSQVRIDKICKLIGDSKYGIHDLSRTKPSPASGLPRFNMPLELGLFLGAKRYGVRKQRRKAALILDSERYRYQAYCSDIAGQDIRAHNNSTSGAITAVRDWLRASPETSGVVIPGGEFMIRRHSAFMRQLPQLCKRLHLNRDALSFIDFSNLVVAWIRVNPR
jgi:hypothetical protein